MTQKHRASFTDLTFKPPCDSSHLTVPQTFSILANSPNLSSCTLGVLLTPVDPLNDDLPVGEVEARFYTLFGVLGASHLTHLEFIARAFDFRRGIGCVAFMPLLEGEALISIPNLARCTLLLTGTSRDPVSYPAYPASTLPLPPWCPLWRVGDL
ncbi:hypothetical protein BDP27DRAFT_1427542 [Rhodocollybia butyracea]|uniref:Uncharacterized protein n=1 Tax=Rhodocollybia butyracea TaxID=206335 RepID=A0A9P5U1V1_9AGAR|nr:hypothetical protein BDP27DRAFT_1427542 [Rhodocollybia butyracea]